MNINTLSPYDIITNIIIDAEWIHSFPLHLLATYNDERERKENMNIKICNDNDEGVMDKNRIQKKKKKRKEK